MSNIWKIHSFHISVPLGDSAIHLLVDEKPSPPQIHSAVLIDGGRRGKTVVNNIKTVISLIERIYTNKSNLRFDSIVITHWDLDHYDGVIGLLKDGFDRTLSTMSTPSSIPAHEAVWIPNWYCKYNIDTPHNPTYYPMLPDESVVNQKELKTCLTTLYVPYSMTNVSPKGAPELAKVKNKSAVVYKGRAGPFGVQGSARGNFVIRGCYNQNLDVSELFASLGPR